MNENKEYVTHTEETGTINISEDVVASIAAIAISEVDGVAGLHSGAEITDLIGKKSLSKGVKITLNQNSVQVDCYIQVKYGYTIPEVAKTIQDQVSTAVESMTGLSVETVNVGVGGIVFEKGTKK